MQKSKKPLTTETQRKAREAEAISGFLAFDFLCALSVSVANWFFYFLPPRRKMMETTMTRQKLFLTLAVFLAMFAFNGRALADIVLPPPQMEGGMGLFEALKKRSSVSGAAFSAAEVKLEALSTVLWAATGLNRGKKGWTVPMADGLPPYCRVYVAGNDGVWRYDWESHSLKEISKENIKGKIAAQSFVQRAFYVLILVSDSESLAALKNEKDAAEFSQVAAGAMSQNVYLAAAALKLGTRYIHSLHREAVQSALKLSTGDEPIALMPLGR
jgi:SagB-type dehydrogenase family enzyme